MDFIIDIIYSILFITGWYALIKYRRNVKSWTGNFTWAEQYIGNGWTYVVLIICGLWMMFFGVMYPFWGMELITGENSLETRP